MDFAGNFKNDFKDLLDSIISEEIEKSGYKEQLDTNFDQLGTSFQTNVWDQISEVQSVFDQTMEEVLQLEKDSEEMQSEHKAKLNPPKQEQELLATPELHKSPSKGIGVPVPIKSISANSTPVELIQQTSRGPIKTQLTGQSKTDPRPKSPPKQLRLFDIVIEPGLAVLAFRKDEWKQAVVVEKQKHRDKVKYKVRFADTNGKSLVQLNHLACLETASKFHPSELTIGTRVAAYYKKDGIFSAVIAEVSRKRGKDRYLIFFDDGYTMYCEPSSLYLVIGRRPDVWNDISNKYTAEYIKNFLSDPVRPMLNIKEGKTLKVEFEGEWHLAQCLRVDQSLVEVLYFSDNNREWIYRGSLRLKRLFQQHQQKLQREQNSAPNRIARAHTGMRKTHIEYIDLTRDNSPPDTDRSVQKKNKLNKRSRSAEDGASVQKKEEATSKGRWEAPWEKPLTVQREPFSQSSKQVTKIPQSYSELQGGVDVASYLMNRLEQKNKSSAAASADEFKSRARSGERNSSAKKAEARRSSGDTDPMGFSSNLVSRTSAPFSQHICTPNCVAPFKRGKSLKGVNPLLKPLLLGWTREIVRAKASSHRRPYFCFYRTPCGRACRSVDDIMRYMMECSIKNLDLTNFSLDSCVRVSNNIDVKPRDAKFFVKDYSNGKETIPISCVNEINSDRPPKMPYSKDRVNGRGVKINTSSDFMVCCDCEDNCRDKSKCACQRLTIQATSCSHGSKEKPDAGYKDKRLYSFLPTGIYECNPRCKCNWQCMNRVVQHGLTCRLQMFKTQKKGWGIRCLDDIAQGTFVCIYTGKIQTEANANSEGLMNGDEYLAELDHIEVAESQKQDANEDDSSGIESQSDGDSLDDEPALGGLANDSTDSEDDDSANEMKMTLKRDSESTWAVSTKPKTNERKTETKCFSTGSRKLGYSCDPEISPDAALEASRKRRGKLVPRTDVQSVDSDWTDSPPKCEPAGKVSTFFDADFTTDTDSDNCEPSPRSLSLTTKATVNKRVKGDAMIVHDDSSSEEDEEINKTRSFFGTEGPYIIDAKQTGNLGRYLNHCCTPNLMVQNVFIDTHDLRFPWVAFFASGTIRAGTELTWDYNYEIGSVPDRVIHCYCGSTKCRKRML